jgi:hypothetical protein
LLPRRAACEYVLKKPEIFTAALCAG